MKKLITLLLAASVLAACASSPTGRRQLMLVSPESAIVQSKQAYLTTVDDLDKENKLLDDPVLADKVSVITGRLVTEAIKMYPNSKDWEWSVAIIDGPETVVRTAASVFSLYNRQPLGVNDVVVLTVIVVIVVVGKILQHLSFRAGIGANNRAWGDRIMVGTLYGSSKGTI